MPTELPVVDETFTERVRAAFDEVFGGKTDDSPEQVIDALADHLGIDVDDHLLIIAVEDLLELE